MIQKIAVRPRRMGLIGTDKMQTDIRVKARMGRQGTKRTMMARSQVEARCSMVWEIATIRDVWAIAKAVSHNDIGLVRNTKCHDKGSAFRRIGGINGGATFHNLTTCEDGLSEVLAFGYITEPAIPPLYR